MSISPRRHTRCSWRRRWRLWGHRMCSCMFSCERLCPSSIDLLSVSLYLGGHKCGISRRMDACMHGCTSTVRNNWSQQTWGSRQRRPSAPVYRFFSSDLGSPDTQTGRGRQGGGIHAAFLPGVADPFGLQAPGVSRRQTLGVTNYYPISPTPQLLPFTASPTNRAKSLTLLLTTLTTTKGRKL